MMLTNILGASLVIFPKISLKKSEFVVAVGSFYSFMTIFFR